MYLHATPFVPHLDKPLSSSAAILEIIGLAAAALAALRMDCKPGYWYPTGYAETLPRT